MSIPKEYSELKLSELPHVVILGAGSSCAANPNGDKNNKKLPMMNQIPDVIRLSDILSDEEIESAKDNFELFFDELVQSKKTEITEEIESRLYNYFDSLELSDELTLYDRLIFSLRRKDLIATFNWDPLLSYSYRRNSSLKTLPHLVFLHGNVLQGVCNEDKILGWKDDVCNICKKSFSPTKLLYPVSNKIYDIDDVINEQWKILEDYISNAYYITIFGYSAPFTDINARERIINHIKENKRKRFLQLEIIDINAESLVASNLKDIIVDTHYSLLNSFDKSWLVLHPRFTCEALFEATMQLKPLTPIPFPDGSLQEYQSWVYELNEAFSGFEKEGNEKQG
ncbi:hypothetical protein EXM22_02020 [Oceanispirochaeta crateris]|uniref:SIR2-like domain-containing protein n=1 Tax=Oceanispirochaeta crateris TaxID=2518645 RepID=A0A5C1QH60_9SPIO|nr:AbiH family protein [Oceanispirochaeta crateris]QEN06827.1 hypothetical protein EXM22_02020 [Oceanispirochaeta crateris]